MKAPLFLLLPCLVALGPLAAAADGLSPADREALYARYAEIGERVTGGTVTAHWLPDGHSFWFAEGEPPETVIYRLDPSEKDSAPVPLFDASRLRRALGAAGVTLPAGDGLPFADFVLEEGDFTGPTRLLVEIEGQDLRLSWPEHDVEVVPPPPAEDSEQRPPRLVKRGQSVNDPDVYEVPSPDGRWLAGVRDGDLWLRAATGEEREIRLTEDGSAEFTWDVEFAHWSADGRRLVTRKVDTRGVHRVPIVHWLPVEETVDFVPLAKTGGKLPRVEIYAFEIPSDRRTRLQVGEETDHGFFFLGFRPDSDFPGGDFLLLRHDRRHKELELLAADLDTGKTRVLAAERQETFVEALRLSLVWPNLYTAVSSGHEKGRFLWLTERDGFKHLDLYGEAGRLRPLTHGPLEVSEVVGVDEGREGEGGGGWVYFLAFGAPAPPVARPYDQHLYRVPLAGGPIERLTEAPGRHTVQLSPDRRYFLDTHSAVDRPPRTELRTTRGEGLRLVAEADTSALEELGWRAPEEFIVKAADGETDLWGVLYKPRDFDPDRKYPILDAIYNGPFLGWVPRTFLTSVGIRAQALAQLGFLVIVVDSRGTPERGKAFQDVAYHRFGQHEIPDHAAALRQLAAERPYVDLDRVGIYGGSWGGYMTLRALLTEPELFKVGVATNPVVNLYDHAAEPIEGYMGLPDDNPDGYAAADNLPLAGRLRGHLLLVHGTSDVNATVSSTMKFIDALIRADRPFDLLILPEQTHNPQGAVRDYWEKARRRYFVEHLKP